MGIADMMNSVMSPPPKCKYCGIHKEVRCTTPEDAKACAHYRRMKIVDEAKGKR